MFTSSRTHLGVLALTLVVAVVLVAAFATIAAASPSYTEFCSNCHSGAAAAPTVNVTSAAGADPVTYSVNQGLTAWAAFDLTAGSKRIAGDMSSDGTFSAPLGHYVRVCASDGANTGTWTQAYILTPKLDSTPHGAVSPSSAAVVAKGAGQAFTFTPDAGYRVSDVKIDGVANPAAVSAGSYSYSNVQADSTIQVTFAPDVAGFAITATAGPNGTVSPAGVTNVTQGSSQTYAITPNAGYQVDTLLVDGVAKPAALSYTFSNVTAAHTIAVTFKVAAPAKSTVSLALAGLKSGAVKLHKSVTAKGALAPARAAKATLTFQRKAGSTWAKAAVKTTTVKANGAYSLAYKPAKKGSWRVQTTVAGTSSYAKAISAWRTFKVK
jgi:hypothetical protein